MVKDVKTSVALAVKNASILVENVKNVMKVII